MINPTEIDKERGAQYGDFRDMAELAQRLKQNLVMPGMSPVQKESLELICTKLARIACGNPNNTDSWVDIAGYANLVVRELNRAVPTESEVTFRPDVRVPPGTWVPQRP